VLCKLPVLFSCELSLPQIADNVLACRYSMAVTQTKSVYVNVNRYASSRCTTKKLCLVKVQFQMALFYSVI
jgi:hypothetical protein